jgi:hypothetical protein
MMSMTARSATLRIKGGSGGAAGVVKAAVTDASGRQEALPGVVVFG